jgi:hypothetical protein
MECPKEISIISSFNELKLDLWGEHEDMALFA